MTKTDEQLFGRPVLSYPIFKALGEARRAPTSNGSSDSLLLENGRKDQGYLSS